MYTDEIPIEKSAKKQRVRKRKFLESDDVSISRDSIKRSVERQMDDSISHKMKGDLDIFILEFSSLYEPRYEKTGLWDVRPGPTQTGQPQKMVRGLKFSTCIIVLDV